MHVIRHDDVVIVNGNPRPSITKTTPGTVGDSPEIIEHHLGVLDLAKDTTRIENADRYKIRTRVAVREVPQAYVFATRLAMLGHRIRRIG
jgi:hypothetical protein